MFSKTRGGVAAAVSIPLLLGGSAVPALAQDATVPTSDATTATATVAATGTVKKAARKQAPSRSRSPHKFGTVQYSQWYATHYMDYKYGWGKKQRTSLIKLWSHESGWNRHAHNGSSGAHGIPQALPGSKMASAGKNWRSNPETQIKWGLSYIKGRYGTPNGAWKAWQNKGWY